MAKLHRTPCEKCGEDTLHRGPICTICGTVVRLSQYHDVRLRRMRRIAATTKQAHGAAYDPVAASAKIRGVMGYSDTYIGQNAESRENKGKDFATPGQMAKAKFGRGRERTRC